MTFDRFFARLSALSLFGLFAWLTMVADPQRAPGCSAPVYQWELLGAVLTLAAFGAAGVILGGWAMELLDHVFDERDAPRR